MSTSAVPGQAIRIFYPLGVVLVFMLNILATNAEEILMLYLQDFCLALIAGLLLGAGVWALCRLAVKEPIRAALLAAVILVFLLYAGDAYYALRGGVRFLFIKLTIKELWHAMLLLSALFAAGLTLAIKLPSKQLKPLHEFLNLLVVLLLIPLLFTAGAVLFQKPEASQENTHASQGPQKAIDTANLPDIYYIILDGYANGNVLKNKYRYDNGYFLEGLEKRGFYVARNSTSNYSTTRVSIPSSLNFMLLPEKPDQWNAYPNAEAVRIVQTMMNQNRAMKYLKQYGYLTVNLGSGWGMSSSLAVADMNVECGQLNEFTFLLLKKAVTGFLIDNLNSDRRARLLCMFDKLETFPAKPERKFVFAHIIAPHPPFLFDKNGNSANDPSNIGEREWDKKLYLEQLEFISKKTLATVDAILKQSERPPIIVIQSDHGPYLPSGTPYAELVKARMFILNAYYVPDGIKRNLTPDITPVNSFRLIFNGLFGDNWDILPPVNFYVNKHLNLWEVTGIVKGTEAPEKPPISGGDDTL